MATLDLDRLRVQYSGPTEEERLQVGGAEIRIVQYFDELRENGHDEYVICRALADALEQGALQPNIFRLVANLPLPTEAACLLYILNAP